jgi:hypothetical protein
LADFLLAFASERPQLLGNPLSYGREQPKKGSSLSLEHVRAALLQTISPLTGTHPEIDHRLSVLRESTDADHRYSAREGGIVSAVILMSVWIAAMMAMAAGVLGHVWGMALFAFSCPAMPIVMDTLAVRHAAPVAQTRRSALVRVLSSSGWTLAFLLPFVLLTLVVLAVGSSSDALSRSAGALVAFSQLTIMGVLAGAIIRILYLVLMPASAKHAAPAKSQAA